ncbi:hypothetical protein [Pedobacter xixiisoli]|uniref:hypothetical protein n=1 Tax=Pedobacter xixiisoli TaxID=1476464 RepID=UPI000BE28F9A|nr:hypothetical protein [Pedobacter xixiisoli]
MKKIILLILVSIIGQSLHASECYHYHTSKTHAIIKKENGIFYQYTEKDPNAISFVQQINKPIKGIDQASYKYAGEDEATFMFSDKNGFYLLPKDGQHEERTAVFSKILPNNVGQKHINGRLFLINDKWIYFNGWKQNITKIVLDGLPVNISNIKCFSSGMYLKSDKQVFSVNIDLYAKKATIKAIPNLNPAQLVYYACNPAENEDFIADEQHIYSVRNDGSFDEVTPQLLALGVKRKFNQLKLMNNPITIWWSDKVLKKRQGHSVSGKNPLTGEDIDINFSYSTSTPLQPIYGNVDFIRFQQKIYPIWDDDFSTPYPVKTDASKLKAVEGGLFQGEDFYYMEADNMKILNTNIPASAKYFTGRYGYGKYLPKALATDKYIYFIGDRFDPKTENKQTLSGSKVKQLGLFYLFNNALFDGKESYPITADGETLVNLGSFVEVINSCAGEMPNTPQVAVKYHQFLKDKNAVYYFDEAGKKLQVIQTANPYDFKADNYEQLQELYKIKDVKGTVKKKTKSNLNFYFIAGGVVFMLGVLGYYLIRRK